MMRAVREDPQITGGRTLEMFADTPRLNAWMYEQLAGHVRGEVLEVGSGLGNLSRLIVRDADRAVLTDMEPAYIDRLRRELGDGDRVEVHRWVLGEPPPDGIAGRTFDAIVAVNVIEHVEDDHGACRTLASMLKPGGHLLAYVPAGSFAYGTLDEALGHFRRYGAESFAELLRGAGLEVTHLRRMNPLGVPGWVLNGRVFRRRLLPPRQVALFERLVWLARAVDRLPIPVGLGIVAHAVKS